MKNIVSFCMPDNEKSCFACCPPIRPYGYEHIKYKNIIKRMLRENTLYFQPQKRPITGYSCWALGYVDKDFKQVGCLLHPAQNSSIDLRYLVDYGDKCHRELCPEAKIFSQLEYNTKKFWLRFADGLDSFSYSSRTINPLFKVFGLGKYVLEYIAKAEDWKDIEYAILKKDFPFLEFNIDLRIIAYPVKIMFKNGKTEISKQDIRQFLNIFNELINSQKYMEIPNTKYTHLLDMDKDFLNFLRLGFSLKKINPEYARNLKQKADEIILKMSKSFWF